MKVLFFFMSMLLASRAFSQEEHLSKPCVANPGLRALLKKGKVDDIYAFAGYEDSFSSSILKPGTQNKASQSDYAKMNEDEKTKYEKWSCQYGARNVSDENPKTAWVEGADGAGAGEVLLLTVQIDLSKNVEIWSGYGASDALFKANNRPRTIGIHVVRASPGTPGQYGIVYSNLTVVASGKSTLEDVNRFQTLTVPRFKQETFQRDGNDVDYAYWLLLEIVDVYPGTKYQDTCISDVRNAR